MSSNIKIHNISVVGRKYHISNFDFLENINGLQFSCDFITTKKDECLITVTNPMFDELINLDSNNNTGSAFDPINNTGFAFDPINITGSDLDHNQLMADSKSHALNQDVIQIIINYLYQNTSKKFEITHNKSHIKDLIDISSTSLVGKGKDTVLDINVRSSREIKSNYFKLSPYLEDVLAKETRKLFSVISVDNKNYRLNIIPHKIIIYSPGDFFAIHMDSIHTSDHASSIRSSDHAGSIHTSDHAGSIHTSVEGINVEKMEKVLNEDVEIVTNKMNKEEVEINDEKDNLENKFNENKNTGQVMKKVMNKKLMDKKVNTVLTLSVDIMIPEYSDEYDCGGKLFVKLPNYISRHRERFGDQVIPKDFFEIDSLTDGKTLRCGLFYHDVLHCVSNLVHGHKLTLTCDVILEILDDKISSVVDHGNLNIANCKSSNKMDSKSSSAMDSKSSNVMDSKSSNKMDGRSDRIASSDSPSLRGSNTLSIPDGIALTSFQSYIDGIKYIQSSGVPRVGFFLRHAYFGSVPSIDLLKSYDYLLYKLMKTCCVDIDIIPIRMEKSNIYHADVFKIFQNGSTFHAIYHECDDDDEDSEDDDSDGDDSEDDENEVNENDGDDCEVNENEGDENEGDENEGDEINRNKKQKKDDKIKSTLPTSYLKNYLRNRSQFLSQPQIIFDSFNAISMDRKYRIGDVAFIESNICNRKIEYKPDSDINLGNSGFDGEVFSKLAIIGTINLKDKILSDI